MKALRVLQVLTVVLLVAGSLTWQALRVLEVPHMDGAWALWPLSMVSGILLAQFCVQAQRLAHDLGGPAPVTTQVGGALSCMFLGFIFIPLNLWRSFVAVARAVGDKKLEERGTVLAWAVAIGPFGVGIVAAFIGVAFGSWSSLIAPFTTVLLQALALHWIAAPLAEELQSRHPLRGGGVDADKTSAAIRSL